MTTLETAKLMKKIIDTLMKDGKDLEELNSILLWAVSLTERALNEEARHNQIKEFVDKVIKESEDSVDIVKHVTDYEALWNKEKVLHDALQEKVLALGSKVYKFLWAIAPALNLADLPRLKFILLEHVDDNFEDYKVMFDPFQFADNMHENIDYMCKIKDYYVIGGGWFKGIAKPRLTHDDDGREYEETLDERRTKIILYGKSGKFGSFDAKKAIHAFTMMCSTNDYEPLHEVVAYPDVNWEDIPI